MKPALTNNNETKECINWCLGWRPHHSFGSNRVMQCALHGICISTQNLHKCYVLSTASYICKYRHSAYSYMGVSSGLTYIPGFIDTGIYRPPLVHMSISRYLVSQHMLYPLTSAIEKWTTKEYLYC